MCCELTSFCTHQSCWLTILKALPLTSARKHSNLDSRCVNVFTRSGFGGKTKERGCICLNFKFRLNQRLYQDDGADSHDCEFNLLARVFFFLIKQIKNILILIETCCWISLSLSLSLKHSGTHPAACLSSPSALPSLSLTHTLTYGHTLHAANTFRILIYSVAINKWSFMWNECFKSYGSVNEMPCFLQIPKPGNRKVSFKQTKKPH